MNVLPPRKPIPTLRCDKCNGLWNSDRARDGQRHRACLNSPAGTLRLPKNNFKRGRS